MEIEDQAETKDEKSKESESYEQKLLKQLISSSTLYIQNKGNIQGLSESLKRIFFHGLRPDKHVSKQKTFIRQNTLR